MRLNRKGSLGFPEAIMAAMIVTLVLTMYMGLLAVNVSNEEDPHIDVDHRIFENLVIENGEVVGDIENSLISEAERHGYRGISFTCEVPGDLGIGDMHILIGSMDGNINSERFILPLRSSDGRIVPTVMEVAVCV
jgi:hypothetical protein